MLIRSPDELLDEELELLELLELEDELELLDEELVRPDEELLDELLDELLELEDELLLELDEEEPVSPPPQPVITVASNKEAVPSKKLFGTHEFDKKPIKRHLL